MNTEYQVTDVKIMEQINKHGIKVHTYETSHWGHTDKEGQWHNAVVQVPECCFSCKYFDDGERGEYGDILTPPYCTINIWFPIRKGQCKKKMIRTYLKRQREED